MEQATKVEIERRIDIVLEMLLRGYTRREIVQFSAKEFGINSRQSDTYIRKAKKRIEREYDEKNYSELRRVHVARVIRLYKEALKKDDHKTAQRILKDIADLHGLYPPRKIEGTGKDGAIIIDISNALERAAELYGLDPLRVPETGDKERKPGPDMA